MYTYVYVCMRICGKIKRKISVETGARSFGNTFTHPQAENSCVPFWYAQTPKSVWDLMFANLLSILSKFLASCERLLNLHMYEQNIKALFPFHANPIKLKHVRWMSSHSYVLCTPVICTVYLCIYMYLKLIQGKSHKKQPLKKAKVAWQLKK